MLVLVFMLILTGLETSESFFYSLLREKDLIVYFVCCLFYRFLIFSNMGQSLQSVMEEEKTLLPETTVLQLACRIVSVGLCS